MTYEEPAISDGARYPAGKAAEILMIDRSTLRRHTLEGLIRFGISRANGRKFYTGAEIKRYWRARL